MLSRIVTWQGHFTSSLGQLFFHLLTNKFWPEKPKCSPFFLSKPENVWTRKKNQKNWSILSHKIKIFAIFYLKPEKFWPLNLKKLLPKKPNTIIVTDYDLKKPKFWQKIDFLCLKNCPNDDTSLRFISMSLRAISYEILIRSDSN